MSKRLQVIMPDEEYRALAEAAGREGKPIGALVRDTLRQCLAATDPGDPERRLAAILRFAKFAGPTGDIDQMLEEIERGRGLP